MEKIVSKLSTLIRGFKLVTTELLHKNYIYYNKSLLLVKTI